MQELQKQFHNFIEQNNLIGDEEKILLAVSGGLDSMVMLSLFQESSYSFGVAHCNFGLRGEKSDQDERFVVGWSVKKGIDCFTKSVKMEGNSIQLEARKKRYAWFNLLCEEKGYDKIATAHHLNDSLETTLLNITRGTGIKGLSGIPVQNKNIIRPLLFTNRDEILAYAKEMKLQWREDSSNSKTDYTRNRIRLKVLPELKEINPSIEQTFKNTKERLDLVAAQMADVVAKVKDENFDKREQELNLAWINQTYHLLILSEILSDYGFNYVTSKEIYDSIGKSGNVFESERWKVVMDRQSLFISKQEESSDEEFYIENEGIFSIGNGELEVSGIDIGVPFELPADSKTAFFDGSCLSFPLKVRKWRQGDVFQPLGMSGSKKVSDLLIDMKVPLAKKADVLILESANEIAWVIGYRISERFKVNKETRSIVCAKLLN